jgi:hypothetical protein
MKLGACVTLATDSLPYRDQMLEEFRAWRSNFAAPFFYTDFPSYGESFFARLWSGKGREIFYLQYAHAQMD